MNDVYESVILICFNKIQFLIVRPSQNKKILSFTTQDFIYNVLTTLFIMQECLSV
jgi:hypothetical protein